MLELVTLEFRMGESDIARRRLSGIMKAQPNNEYARENLAALEAEFGDLKRAAALYEELIAIRPTGPYYANLGFVRFLLKDYAAAESASRRALDLEPEYPLTLFNLAVTLEAQGNLAEAQSLYRALVKKFEAASTRPDTLIRMLHAQCLAHLGRREDAIRLADEVLEQRPEDIRVFHRAAQLYALLGKRPSALFYTEKAREKGLRWEWFTTPEFRLLEKNPEFRALLDSAVP
jgi:predicted Zn-dependent protease